MPAPSLPPRPSAPAPAPAPLTEHQKQHHHVETQATTTKGLKKVRDPLKLPQTEVDARLKSLKKRAKFLDSQFSCCCGMFRFGIESIIGLVPVIGDFAGVFLAMTYMNTIRRRFDIPAAMASQMMFNIAVDCIVGLVPLLGDLVDTLFKANMRNYKLVEEYVQNSRASVSLRELEEGSGNHHSHSRNQQAAAGYIPKIPLKSKTVIAGKLVQKLGKNTTYYGILLRTEPTFDVDVADLRRRFLKLQQGVHPDSYSQKEDIERKLAETQSSWINHAYATLKDPLLRARYLLKLQGSAITEEDKITDPELLMEIMEMREDIEEARTEDQIASIKKKNDVSISAVVDNISQAFKTGELDHAKQLTNQFQYLRRVSQAISTWEPGKAIVVDS
ncbi:molecular chaperone [Dipsacomyces acuminosporus]|nr:molecular chaperone [Dipsacomyces acuminosporus]